MTDFPFLKTTEVHLRVWPDRKRTGKRGAYYDVHIYPTRAQWLKALKEMRGTSRRRLAGTGAIFSGRRTFLPKGSKEKRTRSFGDLFFHFEQFFAGSLTHECVHLGLDYCAWRKINPLEDTPSEELLADFVGNSVLQIVNGLKSIVDRSK